MKLKTALKHTSVMGLAIALSAGGATSAFAAPGTLADSPLFLTNYPQANVFFMLDDSGSMDWEIMVQGNGGLFATNQPDGDNEPTAGPIQQRVTAHSGSDADCAFPGEDGWGSIFAYMYGVEFGSNTMDDDSKDCLTADDQAWRFRNSDFNPLYFDPTKDYTPWYGNDANGQPYQDVSLTNAPDDPYRFNFSGNPSETINLADHDSNWRGGTTRGGTDSDSNGDPDGFWFFTWSDDDDDDNFDNNGMGDTVVGYQIGSITQAQINAAGWKNPPGAVNAGVVKTVAELQQDFANWFSYYRKREYVVKRAVSELMYNSQLRMGMSSLHNNNSIGTQIKDVDNISTPVDPTAQASKATLLDNLFQVQSDGGTPLRRGLRNVGRYFQESTSTSLSTLFANPAFSQPSDSLSNSPILVQANGGECQQHFTVLLSDGFWNGGSPGFTNTDADGAGPWDGGSHADTWGDRLSDVAMHYYETDLATSLNDRVPVIAGVDENTAQHMVTYTVAFGVNGQTSCNPDPAQRNVSTEAQGWPEVCTNASYTGTGSGWPFADDGLVTTVDDMRHAAWNGRGHFLSAGDPQTLIDSLNAAIKDIDKRVGSAAAVSFNTTSLQTDTLVYQAKFDSAGWHGDLRALGINANGTIGSVAWEVAAKLDSRNLGTDPRQIATFNGTAGVAFSWPADWQNPTSSELSTAQINDLLVNAPYASPATAGEIAANDAFGSSVVDFLHGSHVNEGTAAGNFRMRKGHRLGDIVHSGPYYVGPPSTPYPDEIEGAGNEYSTFAYNKRNRDGMVYVGANDGMLHVFESSGTLASPNAGDGREVFAYIPGFLFSDQAGEGLHQLAEQGYVHDYYVDLSPTAADVFISSAWKTYLVGGVRGGGKGVFVLDITDPSALTASNAAGVVKMEFTHSDMGYTFSEVQVGRMNNGKWAAIFGNGYNNTGDGTAKLFILYLDGSGFTTLETLQGSPTDLNGMSTPAIADLNGNGTIDRIVAGDLKGNLWVFDVSAASQASWTPAYGSIAAPLPLYTACSAVAPAVCSSTNRQPITSQPALARHPLKRGSDTYPNLMVFFGTGQYLTQNDNSTTQTQRFYGVWDDGGDNPSTNPAPYDHNDLQVQTITETTFTSPPAEVRTMSSTTVDWSTQKGWYMDLPTSKERVVVSPAVVGEIVFFNTMIPETDVCSQGGDSWLMAVSLVNGGEPPFTVLDVNGDGVWDASDMAGGAHVSGYKRAGIATESKFLPGSGKVIRVTSDSTGAISSDAVQVGPPDQPTRMSWTLQEY